MRVEGHWSNYVKGPEQLGWIFFLLYTVAYVWLVYSGYWTSIVYFKVFYVWAEHFCILTVPTTGFLQSCARESILFLRVTDRLWLGWRCVSDFLDLVCYDSSIFGPNAIEASNAWLFFVKQNWAAVTINDLELSQCQFVVSWDTDQVWERIVEAAWVQLDRLVVYRLVV